MFYVLLVLGILSFWGYMFAVLYLPDYYSFVCASVVFLSVNYHFMLSFLYNSFPHFYVRVPILMDEFVIYFAGQSAVGDEQTIKTIVKNATQYTASKTCLTRWGSFLISLGVLTAYSLTSYYLSEPGQRAVAFVDSLYIIVADGM